MLPSDCNSSHRTMRMRRRGLEDPRQRGCHKVLGVRKVRARDVRHLLEEQRGRRDELYILYIHTCIWLASTEIS